MPEEYFNENCDGGGFYHDLTDLPLFEDLVIYHDLAGRLSLCSEDGGTPQCALLVFHQRMC